MFDPKEVLLETMEHFEKDEQTKVDGGLIALIGGLAVDIRRIADSLEAIAAAQGIRQAS
jgi:hypothetical protein